MAGPLRGRSRGRADISHGGPGRNAPSLSHNNPAPVEAVNCFPFIPTFAGPPTDPSVLTKHLLCCYCKMMPGPPAQLCTLGHLCCRTCTMKIPFCTHPTEFYNSNGHAEMCESRIEYVPLTAYDLIYNRSKFNCPNKEAGCQETPTGENFQNHIESCPYGEGPSPGDN